jgi:hypothetical protein
VKNFPDRMFVEFPQYAPFLCRQVTTSQPAHSISEEQHREQTACARIGVTIVPPGAVGLMPVEEIGDSSVGWRDEAFLAEKTANV